jgi:RNA polymerase sigma-70 factor (sigma-E family)
MKPAEEDAFQAYAGARLPVLLRTSYLLCGDWHRAQDAVSTALSKLYAAWGRASRADNLDAYVHRILTRSLADEARRPWRRERTVAALPEPAGDQPDTGAEKIDEIEDRLELRELLAALPPRQRAVLVLRYYQDLSVDETADALGISAGAVRQLSFRAVHALRDRLAVPTEEATS